jgi:uncharacterized protein (DUF488 family)
MKIYTIGASKKSAEQFFDLLKKNHIEKLLDIRIKNTSGLLGFSKGRDLQYFCEKCHNIKYEHLPLLAPTADLLKAYKKNNNWATYEKEFAKILDSRPIVDTLQQASDGLKNICLLCSEPTPEKCHRRLVAEYVALHKKYMEIIHL